MADYLGLTLETVSRQMSALKRAGVIELDGKRRQHPQTCPDRPGQPSGQRLPAGTPGLPARDLRVSVG
jgi:hypothetical protein